MSMALISLELLEKILASYSTLRLKNLKRCHSFSGESLERILAFTESKTVWHPIGV